MNFAKIKKAQEEAAQGATLIGHLAWWHLNGASISHDDLVAKAKVAGLDGKYLPKPLTNLAAFRRAWRRAARRCPTGLLLREVGETPERVVVGLVREDADVENASLAYDLVGTVSFDKATEVLVIHTQNDVTKEIERLYAVHHEHCSDDIRTMLCGLMRHAAVSLRDQGAVYFLPPTFDGVLKAMAEVVEGIGKNRVYTLPVADAGDAMATLADVARKTLDDEIRAVEAELDAFAANGTETRDGTLARRLTKFDELRARVALFSSCLAFKADALHGRIGCLQEDLRDRLSGRVLEKAVAAAPKHAVAVDDVVGF